MMDKEDLFRKLSPLRESISEILEECLAEVQKEKLYTEQAYTKPCFTYTDVRKGLVEHISAYLRNTLPYTITHDIEIDKDGAKDGEMLIAVRLRP